MPAKRDTKRPWRDQDDAPALTKAWFEQADLYDAGRLVRRGRPKGSGQKVQTTLRLDADIVAAYRASGPGWQTRVNEALRATLPAVRRRAARSRAGIP